MKRSFNFTGNRKLDGYFVASFDDSQNPLAVRASIDTRWLNELKTLDPNLEVAIAASDVLGLITGLVRSVKLSPLMALRLF